MKTTLTTKSQKHIQTPGIQMDYYPRNSIRLTALQKNILKQIVYSTNQLSPPIVALRAKLILLADEKLTNVTISSELKISRNCVARWRYRWQLATPALIQAEANNVSESTLTSLIVATLSNVNTLTSPPPYPRLTTSEVINYLNNSGIPCPLCKKGKRWSVKALSQINDLDYLASLGLKRHENAAGIAYEKISND